MGIIPHAIAILCTTQANEAFDWAHKCAPGQIGTVTVCAPIFRNTHCWRAIKRKQRSLMCPVNCQGEGQRVTVKVMLLLIRWSSCDYPIELFWLIMVSNSHICPLEKRHFDRLWKTGRERLSNHPITGKKTYTKVWIIALDKSMFTLVIKHTKMLYMMWAVLGKQ